MGVGAAGTAAYVGTSGNGMPDDFVGIVHKSPDKVYAAFAALGPEGVVTMPTSSGWGSRIVQRIVKVPNEQVKIEISIDDQPLLTAEVQMRPAEGDATQLAAEFDVDLALLMRLAGDDAAGAAALPIMALPDGMIDQAFAMTMEEMVRQIEEGKPLTSLAETGTRWGSAPSQRPGRAAVRADANWSAPDRVRPQADARPAVDPNEAARTHVSAQSQQSGGWGR